MSHQSCDASLLVDSSWRVQASTGKHDRDACFVSGPVPVSGGRHEAFCHSSGSRERGKTHGRRVNVAYAISACLWASAMVAGSD